MESPAKCKKNADSQGFLNSVRFKNSSGVKKREVHKCPQPVVDFPNEMPVQMLVHKADGLSHGEGRNDCADAESFDVMETDKGNDGGRC